MSKVLLRNAPRYMHLLPVPCKDSLPDGSYLVHAECGGCPHCIALQIDKKSEACVVHDGARQYQISLPKLYRAVTTGVDESTVVIFKLAEGASFAPSVAA